MSKFFIPLLKTFLFLVLILYCFNSYAQSVLPDSLQFDSLKKVLQTEKEDTNKVNTLNALSHTLIQKGNYKNAMQLGNEALSLAEKLNYSRGKGTAYRTIGF